MPAAVVTVRVRLRGVRLAKMWVRCCALLARAVGTDRAYGWALAGVGRIVRPEVARR